ncbi:hypothetical protein [Microbacterium thalassium]|uniref:Uncharacterized protein n=1 Tax=Microbacterium thalassium TaxID=362649 RepID=A0A7X0FM15_9MICO|nr:hypothetical protein [Microbacterium thalassium]MBB6390005.1 hypothetical protein [Microbacterium thalassium]GLK24691.1 hypothetical protein GCM10017607_20090 [Microbacterium thalassium]
MAKVDLAGKLSDARARIVAAETDAPQQGLPKFARLTRKETRVREDQYAALSALARTLMRRRIVKGERITENTLIRVAIDLLLAHQQHLAGGSETELRQSVTSALADSGNPELAKFSTREVAHSDTAGVPAFGTRRVTMSGTPDAPKLQSATVTGSATPDIRKAPTPGTGDSVAAEPPNHRASVPRSDNDEPADSDTSEVRDSRTPRLSDSRPHGHLDSDSRELSMSGTAGDPHSATSALRHSLGAAYGRGAGVVA